WHHAPSAAAPADGGPRRRAEPAGTRGHAVLVAAIIKLARELGLRVVAEAVDDPAQLAFLRRRGCTAVQGLMSRAPLPSEACTSWLRKASSRRALLPPEGPAIAGEFAVSGVVSSGER
ncbi:MAG TPA: EAL domain-containing protein, partial [Geminicoccaceae bacterium]|nr:EAL domain-containing protein [Geminicoccaceae bacterium]